MGIRNAFADRGWNFGSERFSGRPLWMWQSLSLATTKRTQSGILCAASGGQCHRRASMYLTTIQHDGTAEIAVGAGAILRRETAQGKGNVVRRMFSDIDAEIYVIVDGDGTYDAEAAPRLLETLLSGPYDMVNVARRHITKEAYRTGHVFGNRLLTMLVGLFFGTKTTDMLSGYKAFSRRFVKTFPAMSKGFEIETELMIHALDLRLPVAEIEAPYYERPVGSASKLSTFRDGFRILKLLGWLLKHEKPMLFFSSLAGILVMLSLSFGVPSGTRVFVYWARATLADRSSGRSHHVECGDQPLYGSHPRHSDA